MAGPNPWDSDPVIGAVDPATIGRPIIRKGAPPVSPTETYHPITPQERQSLGLPSSVPAVMSGSGKPDVIDLPSGDKTTYRPMTPQEKAAQNLNPDLPVLIGSNGDMKVPSGLKPQDPGKQDIQKQEGIDAAEALINGVRRARGFINDADTGIGAIVGNTATGAGFNLLKHSPVPTDASKLNAIINQEIRGNIFLKRIADLKAANDSPTGGTGIGRIMQAEIPLITGAIGSLDPGGLGKVETLKSLDQIERSALRSKALLNGENPDDPAVQKKYGIGVLGAAVVPPNNGSPPPAPPTGGGNGGGDPVKNELTRRIQSGEDPSATIHWLVSIGRPPDKQTIDAIIANRGNQSPDVRGSGLGHDFAVGLGGVAQGVGDTLGIVSNPFIRAMNYLTGSNANPDMGANVRDTLGLPAPQNDHEQLINRINDYGTQAMSMAQAARLAATRVPGVIGDALEAFGNQPLTDSASGATGGAASELTRQAGGGPLAQTIAGVAAGAPVAAVGARSNAILRRSNGVPDVVAAGQQEGVTVPRAMADRSLEPKVITTGKTVTGAKVMGREMNNVSGQIEGRVNALGDGGTPLDSYNTGETAQNIGKRYISESGAQFGRQYEQLKQQSQGVPIQANESISYIDGLLSRLNKTPDTNAKEISYLTGVRNDLARGLDVESARDIGSRLSRDIRKGDVTFGPMEKDVLDLRKAVSSDITSGLASAGKQDVAARFKQIDGAYQQRMGFIRNTIQRLTGPRDRPLSPEHAASRIQAWAGPKGDSASLEKLMAQATPEERSDIAATFADSLGKNNKGEFSTAILTNNVQRLPRRVRTILFGEEGAHSLDNLLLLANEHSRVTKALGGSPTGLANDARSWVTHALFGSGGALAGGLEAGGTGAAIGGLAAPAAVMAAKIGRDAFSAKSLMSPKITSWLRLAPKSDDPAKVADWLNRLKVIAVREPALSPEVNRIQNALVGAANTNITPSIAASGPNQDNGNE